MKGLVVFALLCLALAPLGAQTLPSTLTWDPEPAVFDFEYRWTLTGAEGLKPGKQAAIQALFGIPATSEYQTISNFKASVGTVESEQAEGQPYLAVRGPAFPPEVVITFRAELRRAWADFDQLTNADFDGSVKPSPTSTYLGKTKDLDPEYPVVKNVADQLWKQSTSLPDFVRRAFLWQQSTIPWSPRRFTGFDDLFKAKSGDCGNQTILFLSILRTKNIPGRLFMGYVIKDGNKVEQHIWPEFWAGSKGWIPADPSYYVGKTTAYLGYSDGLRLHNTRTDRFVYSRDGFDFEASGLQTYSYWYYDFKGGKPAYTSRITAKPVALRQGKMWSEVPTYERMLAALEQAVWDKADEAGLKAAARSQNLTDLAQILANPGLKNRKQRLDDLQAEMDRAGYEARTWIWQTASVPDVYREPWQDFASRLQGGKGVLAKDFTDWGIGHFFEISTGMHHFFFLAAGKN